MPKVDKGQALNEVYEGNIWSDEWQNYEEYREDWDSVHAGTMTWQWYMEASVRRREGWTQIVIDTKWKGATVANWLKTYHPNCDFKWEKDHFLIKDPNVATWMTLKWT